MIPVVYDINTDTDRPVTQEDVDRLQRTSRAFADLAKMVQFHVAEVRNGLIKPGQAIDEIANELQVAENIAASLDMDTLIQGGVHGKHVLVVER